MIYKKIIPFTILMFLWANTGWPSENFKYDAHGKRDPFMPLVGQERVTIAGLENIASIEDVKLEGVALSSDGKRAAIINGELVKEGARSGEFEVKKITKKEVVVSISGKEYKLNLPEEGGSKSE